MTWRALVRDIGRSPALGNVVGIGCLRGGSVPAIGALAEAREVRRWRRRCRRRDASCSRCPISESGGWCRCCATTPRAIRFAESELRDLILHDIQTGTDHVDVLRLPTARRQQERTAAHLHLSRPAVYCAWRGSRRSSVIYPTVNR